jgi:hypothetical protein
MGREVVNEVRQHELLPLSQFKPHLVNNAPHSCHTRYCFDDRPPLRFILQTAGQSDSSFGD